MPVLIRRIRLTHPGGPIGALPTRRNQRGITLLEALVALIITAVAILGMVGVQLRTLADTQTAVRSAQAVRLIEDLSERMKANPNALVVLDDYVAHWETETDPLPTCPSGCSAGALAAFDLAHWRESVKATLPLGDAATFLVDGETTAGARRQLGVMLSWRENENAKADETYRAPLKVESVNSLEAAIKCPDDRICHLQFIQPNARCTADLRGGATVTTLFCPATP